MASTTVEILNQVLALHLRSLPVYLSSAIPWVPASGSAALTTLRHIAEDQSHMADRIGRVILEHGGRIEASEFPMEYTDLHDLSIDYLVPQVETQLEDDVAYFRSCVESLRDAPVPRAIIEEAVGAAIGHLDSVRELSGPALGVMSD